MSEEFGLPLYYQGQSLEQMQRSLERNYLQQSGWNESADKKLALRDGAPIPWFTYAAIEFLENEITTSETIFEFGGGQSTIYWAERVKRIVSVDHDQNFVAYMRSKLPNNAELSVFSEHEPLSIELAKLAADRPIFVDPPRDVRTYRSGQLNEAFKRYALELQRYGADEFDVVVVDGMARNLSTWSAIQHFREGGFIVFDNSDREFYGPAFELLDRANYRRIDFAGLGPINPYGWSTSIFYKPTAFRGTTWFKSRRSEQPEKQDSRQTTSKLGILVLGFNRPFHLQAVLESLRLQGRISDTHVWIDGTQGRGEYLSMNQKTIEIAERYAVKEVRAPWGHFGIEKLMLDALDEMTSLYERVLVLEDDCFPREGSLDVLEAELAAVADNDEVYSIYGHHFGTEPSDSAFFTRFQGWGWAAHSKQIRKLLPELRALFNLNEDQYLDWVSSQINEDITSRLDRTPGRNVLQVLKNGFSWDSATCLLTARDGLTHKATETVTIQNTGISKGVGHFRDDSDWLRGPPFNMIRLDEAWQIYDTTSAPVALDGRSHALENLDVLLEPYLPDEPGFFIELGAFDGVTQSNSVRLEANGWTGLLIEANPGAFAKCVRQRPGCIVEHSACVSSDYEEDTLVITEVGLMSVADNTDFDEVTRAEWLERGASFTKKLPQKIEVPVATLSSLLEKHRVENVDLLLLDVEGAEIDVLGGIDFVRHAPKLILAEDAYDDAVQRYLEARGYEKVAVILERKFTRDQLYRAAQ